MEPIHERMFAYLCWHMARPPAKLTFRLQWTRLTKMSPCIFNISSDVMMTETQSVAPIIQASTADSARLPWGGCGSFHPASSSPCYRRHTPSLPTVCQILAKKPPPIPFKAVCMLINCLYKALSTSMCHKFEPSGSRQRIKIRVKKMLQVCIQN